MITAQLLHVQKDNDIIPSAVKNSTEFDAHKSDFLAKRADAQVDPCIFKGPPSVENTISLPSRGSIRSKASFSSTAKRREAESMTSACTSGNFVSNAMCSNETIAYPCTVGSSGSPLNLASFNIKYNHEGPRFPVEISGNLIITINLI